MLDDSKLTFFYNVLPAMLIETIMVNNMVAKCRQVFSVANIALILLLPSR